MKRHRENLFTQAERNTRELAGRVARSLTRQFNQRQWAFLLAIHAEIDKENETQEGESYSNRESGIAPYSCSVAIESLNY